jgi:hypothetical protein
MDDDSYIHSPITYNLFDHMRTNNKRYAFRQPCVDSTGEKPLREVVLQFVENHPGIVPEDRLEDYKKLPQLGFYSNWFIADMSFFLTPPVSTLLKTIDESKLMYTARSGDLQVQSILVRLFLAENEIKWFRDFSYEHITVTPTWQKEKGCPGFGALSYGLGSDIKEWEHTSQAFVSRFPSNCTSYPGRNDPKNAKCIGNNICQCEDLVRGPCGYYLKKLIGN